MDCHEVILEIPKNTKICALGINVYIDDLKLKGVYSIDAISDFLPDGRCHLKLDILCNVKLLGPDGKEIEICRD